MCMWLWMWLCGCGHPASVRTDMRPFVSHSFVQSFNRKLYRLTHIYPYTRRAQPIRNLPVVLVEPAGCHTRTLAWHMQIFQPQSPLPKTSASPSASTSASAFAGNVSCEWQSPLNSFDAVIWQFLADFHSLTFGFDQLIWITPVIYHVAAPELRIRKGCQAGWQDIPWTGDCRFGGNRWS